MKNLLACWVVFAAFSVSAQQYSPPWNPDADDNGSIGATDVLATLSVYGNDWGVDTSLTCDFVPNDSEQWLIDVLSGVIVIDSIFMQVAFFSVQDVYVLGCPNPIPDTVAFEITETLATTYPEYGSSPSAQVYHNGDGYSATVNFYFYDGLYCWESSISYPAIYEAQNAGFFIPDAWSHCENLPLHTSFNIGSSGIQADQLGTSTEYFQLIPYWHYAE